MKNDNKRELSMEVAGVISIIVPTYNERDNIAPLVESISKALDDPYEIIVVDDNSPDGTAEIAQELAKRYPIRVLKRDRKRDLASAILYGFEHAGGDVLGVIDADLQHPPEHIKEFVSAIEDGYDIAIGSRYIKGGGTEGWSKIRKLISKGAIVLAKPLVSVKDPVTGYFFLRKGVIDGIEFNSTGYKLFLELLVKGNCTRVKEIPYIFKRREKGESKLDAREIFRYLRLIGHLYMYRMKKL